MDSRVRVEGMNMIGFCHLFFSFVFITCCCLVLFYVAKNNFFLGHCTLKTARSCMFILFIEMMQKKKKETGNFRDQIGWCVRENLLIIFQEGEKRNQTAFHHVMHRARDAMHFWLALSKMNQSNLSIGNFGCVYFVLLFFLNFLDFLNIPNNTNELSSSAQTPPPPLHHITA